MLTNKNISCKRKIDKENELISMDKKDMYFIVATAILLAVIVVISLNTEPGFQQFEGLNYISPVLLSAFLITLFIIPLAYFGYKSRLRIIRYISILLLVLTLTSWLSLYALMLTAILIVAYNITIIILSRRNRNNKVLLYSEFFGGIVNLIIILPFLMMISNLFSLPSCALGLPGSCNPGFNYSFSRIYFALITAPIFIFGIFAIILFKQSVPYVYGTLKKDLASRPKPRIVIHNIKTKQKQPEFIYTPVEIKVGLLVAFFFAIIGGIVDLALLLPTFGITALTAIVFSHFTQTSAIGGLIAVLVLPLFLIVILSIYLLIRIATMWNAANRGDINKLRELNSTVWAIIAIITGFLAPTGIILLIMRSPIDNIKRGLSVGDLEKLSKLKKLQDEGVITKEMYDAERKRILGGLK